MAEEKRDNSIFVLGIIIALAMIFYGLWIEEHPVVVEIVELVTNKTVEFLDPKIITRVDKEIVHLTATPGTSVNDVIYATPAGAVLRTTSLGPPRVCCAHCPLGAFGTSRSRALRPPLG